MELANLESIFWLRFFTMDSGNGTTVKLCARRTGLNFNGRQSGGTLGRPSMWKWPVAQAAVLLGLCPAPLNLVLPPAFARAEAGSTRHPFFRNPGPAPLQNRSICAIALST